MPRSATSAPRHLSETFLGCLCDFMSGWLNLCNTVPDSSRPGNRPILKFTKYVYQVLTYYKAGRNLSETRLSSDVCRDYSHHASDYRCYRCRCIFFHRKFVNCRLTLDIKALSGYQPPSRFRKKGIMSLLLRKHSRMILNRLDTQASGW